MARCARTRSLYQRLEDGLQVIEGDSVAPIADLQHHRVRLATGDQRDRHTAVAMLHGIAEQIRQRLLQPVGIGMQVQVARQLLDKRLLGPARAYRMQRVFAYPAKGACGTNNRYARPGPQSAEVRKSGRIQRASLSVCRLGAGE